jgi:uncharacterized membrane protein
MADVDQTSFLAVLFETADAAEQALGVVRALDADTDVRVRDAAVVVRTERGRIELQQTRELAPGEGIVAGGTAGLVAGLLLGVPIGGALLGLAGGAAFGARDTGLPNSRMRELGKDLELGQALLCVLVDTDGIGATRQALGDYGPVLAVDLSTDSDP